MQFANVPKQNEHKQNTSHRVSVSLLNTESHGWIIEQGLQRTKGQRLVTFLDSKLIKKLKTIEKRQKNTRKRHKTTTDALYDYKDMENDDQTTQRNYKETQCDDKEMDTK